jgi:UDP-N-acetylmuramate dehydrogenase
MWKKELWNYLNKHFTGEYLIDELLSLHTWYRIGGPADFFVYPRNAEDLIGLLHQCRALDINIYFIGEGANLLVSDDGYRGIMINLTRHFKDLSQNDNTVTVSSGALLRELVLFAERNGFGGLEYLSGIPGTVGGALTMNAGTHLGEIGDSVGEVYLLNTSFEPVVMTGAQIDFRYRTVLQLQEKILLGCKLALYHEEESILRERRIEQQQRRATAQPLEYPSCGSVFKRPPGHYVGKMVEDLGLKGLHYGDAMISKKHGGFIVNLGNAKASHVMYLIEKVKDEVDKHFHVQLEPEVRFVGF